ncbi:MAG: AraC family transcriptional regulator, partial [Pusillimonas sp.]
PRPLEFELGMDLRHGNGLAWRNLVLFLANSQFTKNAAQHALLAAQVEQLLVSSLLLGQPHNYRDALLHTARTPAPRHVKQAQAYIAEHCAEPIGVHDIARHAAISARSLYSGFQQYCGTTPMAYLRLVRLQRVRQDLLQAQSSGTQTSVTQVALAWGFSHLGHFTAAYRRQFKELPSQTLHG